MYDHGGATWGGTGAGGAHRASARSSCSVPAWHADPGYDAIATFDSDVVGAGQPRTHGEPEKVVDFTNMTSVMTACSTLPNAGYGVGARPAASNQ